jgi:hypothetical protein
LRHGRVVAQGDTGQHRRHGRETRAFPFSFRLVAFLMGTCEGGANAVCGGVYQRLVAFLMGTCEGGANAVCGGVYQVHHQILVAVGNKKR